MRKFLYLAMVGITVISCTSENHQHDGSYSMNIQMFGVSVNSKTDLIINGNMIKYRDKVLNCKQYNDKVDVENGKMIFTVVDGDLVTNVPTLGKIRYVLISGDNNLNQ